MHRDGADWVFVMLVARENVAEGVTRISGADGRDLARSVLAEPLDAVFLDDRRGAPRRHRHRPGRPDTAGMARRIGVTFAASPLTGA